MNKKDSSARRKFLKTSLTTALGASIISTSNILHATSPKLVLPVYVNRKLAAEVNFSVIGINHGHIYGMSEALIRNGATMVSFYAKEPDLAAAFIKRYPQVKQAGSEQEILDDKSIKLVLSAGIPIDRAPLGIRVMQHGKDYMTDKPGIITLKQLAQVRSVQ
ncbi:MAG: gfo/Idh/MocA family oxidoreductase, partial [Saprospiraceae bacterium]